MGVGVGVNRACGEQGGTLWDRKAAGRRSNTGNNHVVWSRIGTGSKARAAL